MFRRTCAGFAVVALAAAGCGGSSGGAKSSKAANPNAPEVNPAGDIPDNQAYVRYAPPGAGYSLKVPEGWSRITSGGATIFTDKLNSVRVESSTAKSPLSVGQARASTVAQLKATVKGFQLRKVGTVARSAGTAVHISYLAAAPPNPVTGKAVTDAVERYVFFHGGHDLVLTLSGPKTADNVDPWKLISDSVAWSK